MSFGVVCGFFVRVCGGGVIDTMFSYASCRSRRSRRRIRVGLAAVLLCCLPDTISLDAMEFFYDPGTGNVAFETSGARGGSIGSYYLRLNPHATDTDFLVQNHIRLSRSSLFTTNAHTISDSTASLSGWEGLFSIGEVLPPGIEAENWQNMFLVNDPFQHFLSAEDPIGGHGYIDVLGAGQPPPATFTYGMPSGEFRNRWDLVDPDELVWADEAALIYRASDGLVSVDTMAAGHISAFRLVSGGAFLADHFSVDLDTSIVGADANYIGVVADAIEPGVYPLGPVLEAGLSLSEFGTLFESAEFIGRAGFGSTGFDFASNGKDMTFVYHPIPEPVRTVWGTLFWVVAVVRGCRVIAGKSDRAVARNAKVFVASHLSANSRMECV